MKKYKLGEIANIQISGVDKKTKDGEIPIKLCNFTDVYYNYAITKEMTQSFMNATAKQSEIDIFKLQKGQVALTKDSETKFDIGVSTYIADTFENVILGYHTALITPNQEFLNGKYLNAFMNTKYAQKYFENNATGSGQRFSLSNETLHNISILAPDLPTQKKIGKLFSDIDKKIAVNNEINKLLEQGARAIYEYYFVQFNFPNANGKPYKSSGGEMIFNPTLNHHIPKTFEVKVMKDFLSVVTGKEDANFATKNGQYAFFTCGDEILRCDKSVFKGKAILIAGNGNFNVKYFDGEFNAYQRTYVLIPKNELYAGILYFSALNRIDIFTKGSNGSIVKFITKGDIENIPVILPNDTQILSVFNTILDKQNLIRIENQKLKALRDFLLPLLLNAQARI